MKMRSIAGILVLFMLAVMAAACQKAVPTTKTVTLDDQVNEIVNSMTVPEKVGQLVMIGIQGIEINDDSRYMLNQYHIGGVILFDRNLQTAEQTRKLTADLQAQADKVPLLVGIDEEGGPVVRGKHFITPPPSAQSLGTAGIEDNTKAESWAQKTGNQLRDLGFNVNFAPVADVGDNPRNYSANPQVTAKFVSAAVQGYESSHVICTLKHFPGIGQGKVDSHVDRSVIPVEEAGLWNRELLPFAEVINNHSSENYMVMVSHLIYPAIDDSPASMSSKIMTDLLRQEMHFTGVIVTDDLEMGAVSKYGSFRDLGVQAIRAGADMVMVCHEYPHETDVYLGLLDAVEKGDIRIDRIDESVKRIVKMKLLHQQ
ncbi:MAG: beta-N-acetylhexosaminidase [Selenomonas sp.]|nr:beta-N-acetylhexosaminidase [Selenomonas sp.]